MSQFRSVKINNIVNSSDRIENLKNQTLYSSGIDSSRKKKNSLYYNNTFRLNHCNCLLSSQSYDMLLSLMKGNNSCNDCSSIDFLQGQMNEANIMTVTTVDMSLCLPSRSIKDDTSWNKIDLSQEVLIDPLKILVNKVSCEPYIYNTNPKNNILIYNFDTIHDEEYYKRINKINKFNQPFQIFK